jgi:hypothetical protein
MIVGSSSSKGKAPLAQRRGSDANRGGLDGGIEFVAVADESVVDDVPNGSVVEEIVFGDDVREVTPDAPDAGIATSSLGPRPTYR